MLVGEKETIDRIDEKAGQLQDKACELGQQGDNLQQSSSDVMDSTRKAEERAPVPGMAEGMEKDAGRFNQDVRDTNKMIKELQGKVNRLKRLTERLKKLGKKIGDPTQLSQIADGIKQNAGEIRATSQNVSGGLENTRDSLDKLQQSLEELRQDISEIQGEGHDDKTGEKTQEREPGDKPEGSGKTGQRKSLSLPKRDLTSLKEIIRKSGTADKEGLRDEFAESAFETHVDEEWLKALKKKELWAECERTGLNEDELREYKGWLELLDPGLMDSMTVVIKSLLGLEEDTENIPHKYSGLLKRPF